MLQLTFNLVTGDWVVRAGGSADADDLRVTLSDSKDSQMRMQKDAYRERAASQANGDVRALDGDADARKERSNSRGTSSRRAIAARVGGRERGSGGGKDSSESKLVELHVDVVKRFNS